jgi:putative DNA primase/helicase
MTPSPPNGSGAGRADGERRPDLARRRGEELLIGRLIGHGHANYQFRLEEDQSYYVKLLTSRGPRTIWGKDLERALRESETKPTTGDLVGARRAAREAVTVTVKERDAEGRVVSQRERHAHRALWVVEKVGFFAERARMARRVRDEQADVREAVRAHPELRSAFLSVRAAEEFATRKIKDPVDRGRFMELIRGAMAGSIQNGQPLPTVKLRTPSRSTTPATIPPKKQRDEPTR